MNHNLNDIITPLDVEAYKKLLWQTEYDTKETEFLIDSFSLGFDIGYKGPMVRQSRS